MPHLTLDAPIAASHMLADLPKLTEIDINPLAVEDQAGAWGMATKWGGRR